jgi:hypothetical protein
MFGVTSLMTIYMVTFIDGSSQDVPGLDRHEDGDQTLIRGVDGKVHSFRTSEIRSIVETDSSELGSSGGGSY